MGKSIKLVLLATFFFCQEIMANSESAKESSTIEVKDIIVPVVTGNKVVATYKAKLNLELASPEKAELAHKFLPRMRDSIMSELYIILPLLWTGGEQPDVKVIAQRLEKAIQKQAPADLISHVQIIESNLFDEKQKMQLLEDAPAVMMMPSNHAK